MFFAWSCCLLLVVTVHSGLAFNDIETDAIKEAVSKVDEYNQFRHTAGRQQTRE